MHLLGQNVLVIFIKWVKIALNLQIAVKACYAKYEKHTKNSLISFTAIRELS